MIVSKESFPVVLQAYEIQNDREVFLAEQVVNNQSEVDVFSARFTGKLIKAKQYVDTKTTTSRTSYGRKRSSLPVILLIIFIIIVALIVIGYSTGWIQQNLGIGA